MNTAEKIAKLVELAPRMAAMDARLKDLRLLGRVGSSAIVAAPVLWLLGFWSCGLAALSVSTGLLGLHGWLRNRLDAEQDDILAELDRFEE